MTLAEIAEKAWARFEGRRTEAADARAEMAEANAILTSQRYCADCGVNVSKNAMRCRSCGNIARVGQRQVSKGSKYR